MRIGLLGLLLALQSPIVWAMEKVEHTVETYTPTPATRHEWIRKNNFLFVDTTGLITGRSTQPTYISEITCSKQ